jgi:aminomethyltransferase
VYPDAAAVPRFAVRALEYDGVAGYAAGTGYTGEDGVELHVPAGAAPEVWRRVLEVGVMPAGLGARDTLRLEAGMPLYGHELSENVDPISAGLEWAVDLSKDFIGAEALRKIAATGPKRRLVGLELSGSRIARQGYPVFDGDRAVGEVTSGTLSPTLGKSIAMAYVDDERAGVGGSLAVDLKGEKVSATVVGLPFYKRAK